MTGTKQGETYTQHHSGSEAGRTLPVGTIRFRGTDGKVYARREGAGCQAITVEMKRGNDSRGRSQWTVR